VVHGYGMFLLSKLWAKNHSENVCQLEFIFKEFFLVLHPNFQIAKISKEIEQKYNQVR